MREFVRRHVDFSAVHANIKRGYLDALCVTASSYDTGRSVSFFQGLDSLRPWSRARPSVPLDEIAAAHAHRLPLALRLLLRAIGVGDGRTHVPSYLVTEGRYCKALMRWGFRDGMARREEICTFLGCPNERAKAHRGPRTARSPAVRPMGVPMPIPMPMPTTGCSVLARAMPLGAESGR